MPEERWDLCWSNNTVLAIPLIVIIIGGYLWSFISPRPQGLGEGAWLIVLILFVGVAIICYCCYDSFEQDKKYKAEKEMREALQRN